MSEYLQGTYPTFAQFRPAASPYVWKTKLEYQNSSMNALQLSQLRPEMSFLCQPSKLWSTTW